MMARKHAECGEKIKVESVPAPRTRAEGEALWREKLRGCEQDVLFNMREWDVLVWEVDDHACLCALNHTRLWDVLWEEVAKVEGIDVPDLARRMNMTTRELAERLESRGDMTFVGSVRSIFQSLGVEAQRRVWGDE